MDNSGEITLKTIEITGALGGGAGRNTWKVKKSPIFLIVSLTPSTTHN